MPKSPAAPAADANPFEGADALDDDLEQETVDRGDMIDGEDEVTPPPAKAPDADTEEDTEAPADADADADTSADADADADTEADTDADADKPAEDKPVPTLIPKRRFDAVNERMKRAEARLAELESSKPGTPADTTESFDFVAKEKEYIDAVLDGETDKALGIRAEIRAAEQAAFEASSSTLTEKVVSRSKAEREFDDTVSELESKVPRFDINNDAYDEALVEEVLDLQAGLVGRGYSPADALRRAARYVVGDEVDGPADLPENPAPSAKPAPRKTDVKAKADAASRQPPSNRNVGQSSATHGDSAIDIDSISDDDFNALPESKKRELRGDMI